MISFKNVTRIHNGEEFWVIVFTIIFRCFSIFLSLLCTCIYISDILSCLCMSDLMLYQLSLLSSQDTSGTEESSVSSRIVHGLAGDPYQGTTNYTVAQRKPGECPNLLLIDVHFTSFVYTCTYSESNGVSHTFRLTIESACHVRQMVHYYRQIDNLYLRFSHNSSSSYIYFTIQTHIVTMERMYI